MTAPRGTRGLRGASLALAGAVLAAGVGCTSTFEVPIDTPIQAKLDVTPFSRVHVVAAAADEAGDQHALESRHVHLRLDRRFDRDLVKPRAPCECEPAGDDEATCRCDASCGH